MITSMKGFIAGALALTGAIVTTADVQAMPIQPLSPAVAADGASDVQVEPVYFRGYRRPFLRFGYRPFFGYRRFGYGYGHRRFFGYRRPFYGYGYRRF